MEPQHREPAENDPNCELRLGVASWDDGTKSAMSVKYAWLNKAGHVARGGEFPVEALPQALDFAIRMGYASLKKQPFGVPAGHRTAE